MGFVTCGLVPEEGGGGYVLYGFFDNLMWYVSQLSFC